MVERQMNISKERLREIIEEEVANVEKEELSKVIEEGYTEAEMTPNYETDLEQALIGLVEVDGWPKDDVRKYVEAVCKRHATSRWKQSNVDGRYTFF